MIHYVDQYNRQFYITQYPCTTFMRYKVTKIYEVHDFLLNTQIHLHQCESLQNTLFSFEFFYLAFKNDNILVLSPLDFLNCDDINGSRIKLIVIKELYKKTELSTSIRSRYMNKAIKMKNIIPIIIIKGIPKSSVSY